MAQWFVGFPSNDRKKRERTFLYDAKDGKKVKEVFWGDWLSVTDASDPDWLKIVWGPASDAPMTRWFRKSHATHQRPLEIIFLDVGQGDGAVLITPERSSGAGVSGDGEAIIVIDAGKGDEMHRFLNKRFRAYKDLRQFRAAILTHPDEDHYGGFRDIFGNPNIGFDCVYQNGLVERPSGSGFAKVGGVSGGFVTGLAQSRVDIETHFADPSGFGRRDFPPVMHAALNNAAIRDFAFLARGHGDIEDGRTYLPGFGPGETRGYTIEVLGPVPEPDATGLPRLRKLGDFAHTKNGHSILLHLRFGRFKVLFGGDLNAKAEKFLLTHYAGMTEFPDPGTPAYRAMIGKARNWFKADVMKVCHHGASDVTDAFIETVKPTAFVISSGDREGHVHPRPDLLGRLGKLGSSASPVILSTELQRSTREREDKKTLAELENSILRLTKAPTAKRRQKMLRQVNELGRSNVEVYGTIYLKTDGERLVTAFKKETNSDTDRWFSFEYLLDANGDLVPLS